MHYVSINPARKVIDHWLQVLPLGGAVIEGLAGDRVEVPVMRMRLRTGQTLFEIGDEAVSYYALTRGALAADFGERRGAFSCCLLAAGTMFSLACGQHHVARCTATADSEVMRINRKQLERLAHSRPALRSALQAVHGQELSLILAALRPDEGQSMHVSTQAPALVGTSLPKTPAVIASPDGVGQDDRPASPRARRPRTSKIACDNLALA